MHLFSDRAYEEFSHEFRTLGLKHFWILLIPVIIHQKKKNVFLVWQGVQKQLPLVFLRGSNIRFVHIPDNVDITKLVENRVSVDTDSREHLFD